MYLNHAFAIDLLKTQALFNMLEMKTN